MRLTASALLCAALFASPALAHDHRGENGPPPGAELPPPPPGYGYGYGYGAPLDPRWEQDQERLRGEWMERCGHRADGHDGPLPPPPHDCGYRAPYVYPGAYMGYAVPMVMVPVMRSKPCKEVVEEIVEYVPVRRRVIPRRPRAVTPVPDKRVRLAPEKRVPVIPTKRIPY